MLRHVNYAFISAETDIASRCPPDYGAGVPGGDWSPSSGYVRRGFEDAVGSLSFKSDSQPLLPSAALLPMTSSRMGRGQRITSGTHSAN